MSFDVQNALSIGTDSEGGFLAPDEYERTLVERLEEENFFRSLAHVIRTSSGDRKIPIVTSKGEAAWIDEGERSLKAMMHLVRHQLVRISSQP